MLALHSLKWCPRHDFYSSVFTHSSIMLFPDTFTELKSQSQQFAILWFCLCSDSNFQFQMSFPVLTTNLRLNGHRWWDGGSLKTGQRVRRWKWPNFQWFPLGPASTLSRPSSSRTKDTPTSVPDTGMELGFVTVRRSIQFCSSKRHFQALALLFYHFILLFYLGDSGGGMVFPSGEGADLRYYLQGIVSVGVPDPNNRNRCNSNQYSLFTRVGRFADWIVRTLTPDGYL
jgi:hypothetical protein